MADVRIVTDSTAYIPRRMAESSLLTVVPLSYMIGGHVYQERYPGENGDFEDQVLHYGAGAKTLQPSVAAFAEAFNRLHSQGHEVVAVTLSSRLSGTYSSACVAARAADQGRISVVDSLTTVYGQYLLIEHALNMAKDGAGRMDIASELESMRPRIGTLFSVNKLDSLQRGGRLDTLRRSVSTMLNLRPIIAVRDGLLVGNGLTRGSEGMLRELSTRIPQEARRIGVMHLGAPELADSLQKLIQQRYTRSRVERWDIGPVIGIHLGTNAMGVTWLK